MQYWRAGAKNTIHVFSFVLCLSLALSLASCLWETPRQIFYTWQGIGPDIWASVWLIHRKIDPEAMIRFIPVNEDLPDATAFDIPNSPFVRTNDTSALAKMVSAYSIESGVVDDLIQIIHDIEVDFWSGYVHPRSPAIEIAYRDLQASYGREKVSFSCYLQFFDNLAGLLSHKPSENLTQDAFKRALTPDTRCIEDRMDFTEQDRKKLVEEVQIRELLNRAAKGEKIVYLDAREPNEFDEFHIPGAINLRLRDVNASVAKQFKDADKVIAYCLKDFRGFELARALQQKAGLRNTAIMKPYGINGWKASGLPVSGTQALEPFVAQQRLQRCVKNPDECLQAPE
jgi:rhodanese-related sulfurtransferase